MYKKSVKTIDQYLKQFTNDEIEIEVIKEKRNTLMVELDYLKE